MNEIEPTANGEGRRPDGKFAKGVKHGPGNPRAATVEKWRARLLRAEMIGLAIEELKKAVQAGDMDAIKTVLAYALGKPVQPVKLSGGMVTEYVITITRLDAPADHQADHLRMEGPAPPG